MRYAIMSFMAVLLLVATAFAVDPGVPDSVVYQERVYAPLNQGSWSTAYLNVYFVTDDSVSDVTVPTTWRSSDNQIYADSIIWSSFMMLWDDYWSSINRDTSIIHILGFSDLGGDDNPPLYTNLERFTAFTIRFRISPTANPQIVTIDTTRDRRMGSANFGPIDGGSSFTPIVVPGSLYYGIQTDVGASGDLIPSEYMLEQNFPNPFNPSTQIAFEVPSASVINLDVYNLLGQKIKTLVSEYKDSGRYSVSWDGTNEFGQSVPSGVYFYRLTTKDHSETKRMMLLK